MGNSENKQLKPEYLTNNWREACVLFLIKEPWTSCSLQLLRIRLHLTRDLKNTIKLFIVHCWQKYFGK